MTVPSLSSREAHLLGDIVEEGRKAIKYLGGRSASELTADDMRLNAILKVLQNTVEACIQIDGKKNKRRFDVILPDHDLDALKEIGNLARHDYGAANPMNLIEDVTVRLPPLIADAEALLDAHRRLHGGG